MTNSTYKQKICRFVISTTPHAAKKDHHRQNVKQDQMLYACEFVDLCSLNTCMVYACECVDLCTSLQVHSQ